jgi:DNA (cytosine-5)-methyltransferase 1
MQENGKAQMMSDTYGPTFALPSMRYDLNLCSWRTCEATSLWDLEMSSPTFSEWGMTLAGELYELSDAGAPHGRARVFIVAHAHREGLSGREYASEVVRREGSWITARENRNTAHTHSRRRDESLGESGDKRQENSEGTASFFDGHCADQIASNADDARPSTRTRLAAEKEHSSAEHSGNALATDASCSGSQGHGLAGVQGGKASSAIGIANDSESDSSWGEYEPAIRRWERIVARCAPTPTHRLRNRDSINPAFVEWMMGLPEGHVTGHGLRPAQELKMLGNGVVPQQAALALRLLGVR